MLPGHDVLERKFEGYTEEEIIAEVNKLVTAAYNTLVRRGSQLRPYELDAFAPPAEEVTGDPVPVTADGIGGSGQEPPSLDPPANDPQGSITKSTEPLPSTEAEPIVAPVIEETSVTEPDAPRRRPRNSSQDS